MNGVDLSKMHRSELEATVVHQAKLMERYRRSIANIVRDFEDEGDRVYLGSTNDADELIDLDGRLSDSLNELECPWIHGTDLYAELRELRAEKRNLRETLEWIKGQSNLFFAECSQAEEIIERVNAALAKARNGGER